MLRQYPPGAGDADHLRFFYAYGCRLANFRLVVVCRSGCTLSPRFLGLLARW